MTPSKDVFVSAIRQFRNRLTKPELDNFRATTITDVYDTIKAIQKKQDAQKEMMNLRRIQSFLEAMEQFAKIIEIFLNVASTWAYSFDTLLDAYEQIGKQIPLLKGYEELFGQEPATETALISMYENILEFHRQALKFFSSKVWRQVFKSVWNDFNTRFGSIISDLKRHGSLVESHATLLHYQHYETDRTKFRDRLVKIQAEQKELAAKMTDAEKCRREANLIAVTEWIAAASMDAEHNTIIEARAPYGDSGLWILKHPKILQWTEDDIPDQPLLWIHGMPGAGKTVLASVIITRCIAIQQTTTAYFYCRYDDDQANTGLSILKGLLVQQIHDHLDLLPYFYDQRLKNKEVVLSLVPTAKQLVELVCQRAQRQYIIVDGLDECEVPERRIVLEFFNTLIKDIEAKDPGKLRVLFMSQNEGDIKRTLTNCYTLELDAKDNSQDIETFTTAWTSKIQSRFDLSEEQKEYIRDKTCTQAAGQFLYAKLVLENLYAQQTKQKLLDEIDQCRFPSGLTKAYERIVDRIRQRPHWEDAQRILGWMACAVRPLKWREMQGAISIDLEDGSVDFDRRRLRADIEDICGAIVRVNADRVTLIHATARLFISNSDHIDLPTVKCNLADLCLRYLSFEYFDEQISKDTLDQLIMRGDYAFADYAVAKWLFHFCQVIEQANESSNAALTEDLEDAIQAFGEGVDEFSLAYEYDLTASRIKAEDEKIDMQLPTVAAELFKEKDYEDQLRMIWIHVSRHQRGGLMTRHSISLSKLENVLRMIREATEALLDDKTLLPEHRQQLIKLYGERQYKCSKAACYYFHEGFKDAATRDFHVNRHDRPFLCEVSDCSSASFGFSRKADLDNHNKLFHADIELKSKSFPTSAPTTPRTKWVCGKCNKHFARNGILKSHLLTHEGTRPFECSRCGKAFTRKNDCVRHEKNHDR